VFQDKDDNPYAIYGKLVANVAELRPDLVALPESAMCEFGAVDHPGAVRFADVVREQTGGAAVLAGGSRCENGRMFNAAALYTQERTDVYDKVHLVPFGEFIPGDKLFPALQKLAPVGSCTPGELKLLKLPVAQGEPVRLGVSICFEDTDSALSRRQAQLGAQMLVFITNDSWFSRSVEPWQHAWQATCRALETGLPVVRVGNSGVSGTIAPTGQTSWLVGSDGRPLMDRRGTMFDRIPVADASATPYVVCGDWPLGIAFCLLIVSMVLIKYQHKYEKRRQLPL